MIKSQNHQAMDSSQTEPMPLQNRIQLLQSMPIFGGIRADTLEFLIGHTSPVELSEGDYFYHEGDQAQSLFVLEDGDVVLLKNWQGHQYRLKQLERGHCFGEVALIDLQPRNTSALATSDCRAIELSDHDFHRLYLREIEQFALIRMNMAREVCRRLREADSRAFEADIHNRRLSRSN